MQFLHRRRLADDFLFDDFRLPLSEIIDLLFQPAFFNKVVQDDFDLIDVKRLREIIRGAQFHGLYRSLGGIVGRQHDHLRGDFLRDNILQDIDAVLIGNPDIKEDDRGRPRFDFAYDAVRSRCGTDLIAAVLQHPREHGNNELVIINKIDFLLGFHVARIPSERIMGRLILNVAPPPAFCSMPIFPPWSSTSRFEIARPNPVPLAFVVKKGWKILSVTAASMPLPVSDISTRTVWTAASY